MRLTRNPIVVFGAFTLLFWLVLWAGSLGDLAFRAAIWGALVAMSVVAVVKLVRSGGRSRGAFGQDAALPDRIRVGFMTSRTGKSINRHGTPSSHERRPRPGCS